MEEHLLQFENDNVKRINSMWKYIDIIIEKDKLNKIYKIK